MDEIGMTRIAQIVYDRRQERSQTIRDAAAGAGVTAVTWNNVELGRKVLARSYRKIERHLGLPALALDKAADGRWVAGQTPASGPIARITTMVHAVETDTEIPAEDRASITASMTATLAHLREREAG